MTTMITLFLAVCIFASTLIGSTFAVDCISAYDSAENYFPFAFDSDSDPFALSLDSVSVNTAFDFTVQYSNSYKTVRNSFSNDTYVLYQCGSPTPKGFSNSTKLIEIPVKGIALTGTTPISYLELLGLINQVKQADYLYTVPYIVSPCMQKIISESKVKNLNKSSNVLVFEDMLSSSAANNSISFDATSDPGPLKRAEWIKFLALFFNLEAEATSIYTTIKENYDCFNGSSSLSIKPVVAWINFYDNVWTVSGAPYKTELVKDAGGLSVNESYFGMYNMTNTTQKNSFTQILERVDIVIDETFALDPPSYDLNLFMSNANISSLSMASYAFLMNKRVWREDRRVSSTFNIDWLETAPSQPHIVLQELIGIINPSVTYTPYFFRNIAMGEEIINVTINDCTSDYNKPLKPMVFTCPINVNILTSSTISLLPNFYLFFGLVCASMWNIWVAF